MKQKSSESMMSDGLLFILWFVVKVFEGLSVKATG